MSSDSDFKTLKGRLSAMEVQMSALQSDFNEMRTELIPVIRTLSGKIDTLTTKFDSLLGILGTFGKQLIPTFVKILGAIFFTIIFVIGGIEAVQWFFHVWLKV